MLHANAPPLELGNQTHASLGTIVICVQLDSRPVGNEGTTLVRKTLEGGLPNLFLFGKACEMYEGRFTEDASLKPRNLALEVPWHSENPHWLKD